MLSIDSASSLFKQFFQFSSSKNIPINNKYSLQICKEKTALQLLLIEQANLICCLNGEEKSYVEKTILGGISFAFWEFRAICNLINGQHSYRKGKNRLAHLHELTKQQKKICPPKLQLKPTK